MTDKPQGRRTCLYDTAQLDGLKQRLQGQVFADQQVGPALRGLATVGLGKLHDHRAATAVAFHGGGELGPVGWLVAGELCRLDVGRYFFATHGMDDGHSIGSVLRGQSPYRLWMAGDGVDG